MSACLEQQLAGFGARLNPVTSDPDRLSCVTEREIEHLVHGGRLDTALVQTEQLPQPKLTQLR